MATWQLGSEFCSPLHDTANEAVLTLKGTLIMAQSLLGALSNCRDTIENDKLGQELRNSDSNAQVNRRSNEYRGQTLH